MKKLAFALPVIFALNTLGADEISNAQALWKIVNDYRQSRFDRVDQTIQTLLEEKQYWLSVLQEQDTRFGYFENTEYIFVSNKSTPDLSFYRINYGKLTEIGNSKALVGSGKGNKNVSGDLTTPIGVYDLKNKLTKLDQYYGAMAFVTSYPNAYDKSLKKTGYGIWIHGMPLNGNRDEVNTKGCIAIENEDIKKYDRSINLNRTILIVYEGLYTTPTNEDLASVLAEIHSWKSAWQKGDFQQYLSFYDPGFKKSDGTDYKTYLRYKASIFNKKEKKDIKLFDINVVPYPNERGEKLFRVTFNQKYSAYKGDHLTYTSDSFKEIYLRLSPEGKISILLEE